MEKAALVIVGMALAAFFLTPHPALVIRQWRGGDVLIREEVRWGECFQLCYIHSVDKKPVCEVFVVDPNHGIVLRETYFRMFGAGMGHWEGHGRVVQRGEWIAIEGIDKPLGSFLLRVGSRGVDHTLKLRGKALNLSEHMAERLVEVKVEDCPRALLMFRKVFGR